MFGTVAVSVSRSRGGTVTLAAYCSVLTSASAYAALVPLMLYWMYGLSLSRGLGFTANDWTPAGMMPPMTTAEMPSSASATPGHTRLRANALENTRIATATTSEIQARISLAGSSALIEV